MKLDTRTIRPRPSISTIPSPRPLPWHEGELTNGIRCYVVPDRSLPWVSLRIVFDEGALRDGDLPGLSDFTAGLLSSGAGRRDAIAFARDVEHLGADIGADAGYDSFVVEFDAMKRSLPEGLDLLSDLILEPRFETEEIERDRSQHIAGLRSLASEPDWLADTELRRHVLTGTPYAEPIEGVERVIRSLDRDQVVARHHDLLRSHAFVIAAGDIDVDELVDLLNGRIGQGTIGGERKRSAGAEDPPSPSSFLIDRHGSAHTSIRLARPAVPRRHPDRAALRVVTTILGDYFNSRLNNRLREDLGYTYGAWATLDTKRDRGSFWIGTSVGSRQVEGTIRTIREEIDRIGSGEVDAEELELVTRYMAGRHALSRETAESVGGLITTILLYDLPRDHYTRALEEVRSLTPERLLETARKYFRSEEFSLVVAGEADRLRGAMESLGEFTER